MTTKYPYKHFARDMTYTEFAEQYCELLARWIKEQRATAPYWNQNEKDRAPYAPDLELPTDHKDPDSLISQLSDLVDNHPDYEKQFDDNYHEKHDTQFKQALASVGLS